MTAPLTQAEHTTTPGLMAWLLNTVSGRWRMVPVLLVLCLIWAYFGFQNPVFLSSRNITNLSIQIVMTTVLALGLLFVLLIGELDLSVAVSSAVSAAVAADLAVNSGLGVVLCFLVALVVGGVIGCVQGLIVEKFRAPAFIVTLGVSLALQGVLLDLLPESNMISLVGLPLAAVSTTYLPALAGYGLLVLGLLVFGILMALSHRAKRSASLHSGFGRHVAAPLLVVAVAGFAVVGVMNSYRGVPLTVALLFVLLAALSYVTTQTRFGLYLYAIGASREAARRAGIPVGAIRVVAFTLTGVLAALAGMIAATRVMAVSTDSADSTMVLEAIAAAVIGGVSLFGGRGSVWSALVGALVMGSITNGMLLISASTQTRLEVQGAILVLAVVLDAMISRRASLRH
ncbi:MAG: inner-membrane translocator [Alphaproteobacteria bacterium]|nr:inner-membrane translocator [Alphaproteobacteria bacterium]